MKSIDKAAQEHLEVKKRKLAQDRESIKHNNRGEFLRIRGYENISTCGVTIRNCGSTMIYISVEKA